MSKKRINYYAVAVGRKPGIYTEWYGGAFEQVDKFKGAIHKGFYYKEDAEAWLKEKQKSANETPPKLKEPKKIFYDWYEVHGKDEPPF